jgi:predicted transcriptional regulator
MTIPKRKAKKISDAVTVDLSNLKKIDTEKKIIKETRALTGRDTTDVVEFISEEKYKEELLQVSQPTHVLLEKLRSGDLQIEDLSVDDKFVVIRYMREEEKMTPDEIAEELVITRQTVISYCNKIKRARALNLADTDVWELGGEIYQAGKRAMEEALAKGKYKDFAYLMTSLVATLQSMGLVYKMPKQSQIQQNIVQEMSIKKGSEGFKQLKQLNKTNELNLDNVFTELLGAVKDGKLDGNE